jgi:hypothetical protein
MTIGVRPEALAVGRLDSDPYPDFAVGLTSTGKIAVVRGDGTGGLHSDTVVTLTPSNATVCLALGDLTNDGRLDLVSADVGSGFVSVFKNTTPAGNPSLSFAAPISLRAARPCSVQCVDMNGDGLTDILVGGLDGATSIATIFLNTTAAGSSTPTFSTSSFLGRSGTSGGGYVGAVAADVNGDGIPDVALTHGLNDPSIGVFVGTTLPGATSLTFAPPVFIPASPEAQEIHSADLNRDGLPDLVTADSGTQQGNVGMYLNETMRGSTMPHFSSRSTIPVVCQNFMQTVAVGDLNGDGIPDLVAVDLGNGGNVVVWLGTGSGSFIGPVVLPGSGPRAGAVALADVNLDGKLDVVVAGGGAADPTQPGQLIIYLNH